MPERTRQDQVAHVLWHRHDVQHLRPTRLRLATLGALLALTVAWFFLGSAAVSAALERGALSPGQIAALGAIVTVNFAALILASVVTYRPPGRWGDVFVVIVLVVNVAGSVLDQVGLWDVVYLLGSLAALILALLTWRRERPTRFSG